MERSYKAFAVTFELKFPFPLMKMFEFQLKIHKFVPECQINIPALVQIMAYHLVGAKPLSEPMITSFLTHIYVTQDQ